MKKIDEINNPTSCFNRALPEENIFTLLGRDVAAPDTIRKWAAIRVTIKKNDPNDPQILEALALADEIEKELRATGKLPYIAPAAVETAADGLVADLEAGKKTD